MAALRRTGGGGGRRRAEKRRREGRNERRRRRMEVQRLRNVRHGGALNTHNHDPAHGSACM